MNKDALAGLLDAHRPLTDAERRAVDAARHKAFVLYEGKQVPHRSCGIALAETFGLRTEPYQALRRGGLLGLGECGAVKAGELILGELLGDPDPAGGVRPVLRAAAAFYREAWLVRLRRGGGHGHADDHGCVICQHLVSPFADFVGPERQAFCTNLAAQIAEMVAETLIRAGYPLESQRFVL